MNLPNKLTMARIFISIIIIAILLFPFDSMGITTTKFFINESLVVDIKYLIAGVLFIIGSLTDFLDGYIARKYNLITDFGKLIDAIADKMLVNSVLIILASTGTINAIIPVVVILRDTVVNSIKMLAASKGKVVAAIKSGKLKTACLMTGITLTLFYNLPFELWNLQVANILLLIATVLSIYSGVQYYILNKDLIFDEK
ncbi:MAG: CDP-diacylglycerol--glycerol-3-phosphate 3-phosphatidyltransferase [Tenericutes bacterium]|nr:CDP-diacylglycerol--glycerol-3-phosphate 3-phosphatidyltransferase [Mycoplasmatota bacterium]MDY3801650.1 CDP-diacylglycerol--glycerol-3-phosphate 3-phosphatidyltransferase [Bacilli bacterium]